jgi:DNA-directed RNA polymerase specialized sigma24 family protein
MEEIDYSELYQLTKAAIRRSRQWVSRDFEDTVQEAMLFILRNIKYYDKSKGTIGTFVFSNVKRSMVNQTVYLNAKKRQDNSFLISLDQTTVEGSTMSDMILSDTSVEYEVMWSSLMDKLTPLEQDIVWFWTGKTTKQPLQIKHNIPKHALSRAKLKLKEKLKTELLLNFDIIE